MKFYFTILHTASLQDIKLSNDLEDVLRKFDIFEPENELNERINVLQQLNSLAKQWIIDLSIQRVSEICVSKIDLISWDILAVTSASLLKIYE